MAGMKYHINIVIMTGSQLNIAKMLVNKINEISFEQHGKAVYKVSISA